MKTKLFVLALAIFAVALFVPFVSAKKESKEAAMVREAKITMTAARKTALVRVAGKVERARLKRERGKLLFEFEIHDAQNAENEIHIDAVSGEIFEVKKEKGGGSTKESAIFSQAKVSMDDAEQTALTKVPGAVVMAQLERERSKVLYEFEIITSDGKEAMVHVDASNGQVEQVKQD